MAVGAEAGDYGTQGRGEGLELCFTACCRASLPFSARLSAAAPLEVPTDIGKCALRAFLGGACQHGLELGVGLP